MSIEPSGQRPCCVPAGASTPVGVTVAAGGPVAAPSGGVPGTDPTPLATIPGGRAALGDHFGDGYAGDGEGPVHEVQVSAFRLGTTTVTNAAFAAFVDATGHRTTAEAEGYSAVFHTDVAATVADVLGYSPATPWWVGVRGADWRHPEGPRSGIEDRADHPVVHVSHDDALAYARWAGRRLPTEAEWEYAARGGLAGKRYPWGDELMAGDTGEEWQVNIFQGSFPATNTAEDGWTTTAPVTAYRPNGYGLHQMVGNVWEWCSDWFDPTAYDARATLDPRGPASGTVRVMRGGSFLCHDSYCNRYRVAARSAAPPDSTASNLGFRCAADSATDAATDKENHA